MSNIVYNANGSDVTDVFVDGRQVIAQGKPTLIDGALARRECPTASERLWQRARALFDDA